MEKKILILGVAMILSALIMPVSLAETASPETLDSLIVYRIYPSQAFIGEKAWITLVLENQGSSQKTIILKETLGAGSFDTSQAKYTQTAYGEKLWYYEWKITLPAWENTSVTYWLSLSSPGVYVISPAQVNADGKSFRLKSRAIQVMCNSDGTCSQGENYLNCPEDCETGGNDGICDSLQDGKCDPDCQPGADPDCSQAGLSQTAGGAQNLYLIIGAVAVLGILGLAVYLRFFKK